MPTLPNLLIALSLTGFSPTAPEPLPWDQVAADYLQATPLDVAVYNNPMLGTILETLTNEVQVTPEIDQAWHLPTSDQLVLIQLRKIQDPDAFLFMYYATDSGATFFLQVRHHLPTGPEVRLWSTGESEILISGSEAVLLPRKSDATFRLTTPANSTELQLLTQPLTVSETIACLGRVLGISINATNLRNLLTSASCTATNTAELVLTALNCLSPTPQGIIGCTVGIARIISCSLASCSGGPGAACVSQISSTASLSSTWTSTCRSTHRSGSFAKFFTFTLATTTTVQIDLESSMADPFLFLLRGNQPTGSVLTFDDDSGPDLNSRIVRTLLPGSYTIEATTFTRETAGTFRLRLSRR